MVTEADWYHIRPAVESDIQSIAEVHVASWHSTYVGIVPQSVLDHLSVAQRMKSWSATVLRPVPQSSVMVAEDDSGQVVGFVAYGRERQGRGEFDGEVFAIYLLPAVQRRGLGRALIRAAARELQALNMGSLLLWVLADNPACHFYAALGGELVDETTIRLGGAELREVAYGWHDLMPLL